MRHQFCFHVTEYCVICLGQEILFLDSNAVILRDFFLTSFWRVCVCVYFSSSSGNISSRKEEANARDTYVSSFPRAPSTSDSVRLKCREMLAAALRTGGKFSVPCSIAESFVRATSAAATPVCLPPQQQPRASYLRCSVQEDVVANRAYCWQRGTGIVGPTV